MSMAVDLFLKQFEERTRKSKELYTEACEYLPGGVAGSAAYLAPRPIYVDRAEGARLVDVDGNEYIDLLLGGFPNILGHRAPVIMDAVKAQLDRAVAPILFQGMGIELAKKIRKHMPHMERIRFANTGSEATQNAIRAARAFTKKEKIAKIEGGYNGGNDYVLISGVSGKVDGPPDRPLPVADCAGIPQCILDNTVIIPFNDPEATVAIIREHGHELAGVLIEPLAGFGMGCIPADKDYLQALRDVTRENNVLLIYDEIVTAFRLAGMGGAAKYYGIAPDLDCVGKPIGGGFPVGGLGGRKDIMEATCSPTADPGTKMFQSGTFTGNPITMAAGLACLTALETKDYAYIDGLGEKVRTGLRELAARHGMGMQITGLCSIFMPHVNSRPIRNNRDKIRGDAATQREFCLGMIVNGVYLPPMHAGAICFAHTGEDVDQILKTADKVMGEMKQ
jgi:glutamate-1-semialdehyde 2,1-aminomutase